MNDHVSFATTDTFETVVLGQDRPVLVDFYAEWCGPCKTIAPAVDAVAVAHAGHLSVAKVNVDESPGTPGQYGVRAIPTVLAFQNGEVVDTDADATVSVTLSDAGDSPLVGIEQYSLLWCMDHEREQPERHGKFLALKS